MNVVVFDFCFFFTVFSIRKPLKPKITPVLLCVVNTSESINSSKSKRNHSKNVYAVDARFRVSKSLENYEGITISTKLRRGFHVIFPSVFFFF